MLGSKSRALFGQAEGLAEAIVINGFFAFFSDPTDLISVFENCEFPRFHFILPGILIEPAVESLGSTSTLVGHEIPVCSHKPSPWAFWRWRALLLDLGFFWLRKLSLFGRLFGRFSFQS